MGVVAGLWDQISWDRPPCCRNRMVARALVIVASILQRLRTIAGLLMRLSTSAAV
ncbi:hypothetical protein ABIA39_008352 [Nocardia sp. GAS34]